jgi:hypothetical protein
MLEALSTRLNGDTQRALKRWCDEQTLTRDPTRPGANRRLAIARIDALAGGGAWPHCTRDPPACELAIDGHITTLRNAAPNYSFADQLEARRLASRGKPAEADAQLASRCTAVIDQAGCAMARAQLAFTSDLTLFAAASKQLIKLGCADRARCATTHAWIGARYHSRKRWHLALSHYHKAARADGGTERWLVLAKVASRAGADSTTADALRRVLKDPKYAKDETLRAWYQKARSKAVGGGFGE